MTFLWSMFEDGRVFRMTNECRGILVQDDKREAYSKNMAENVQKLDAVQPWYFVKFMVCEVLTLVTIIGYCAYLIWLMEVDVMDMSTITGLFKNAVRPPVKRTDNMMNLFPRRLTCMNENYGPSGTIQRMNALCDMPFQFYNEWFHIIALVISIATAFVALINFMSIMVTIAYYPTALQRLTKENIGNNYNMVLALLLIYQNVDTYTYEEVARKALVRQPQKPKPQEDQKVQRSTCLSVVNIEEIDSVHKRKCDALEF
jgi:hypothetical protein